MDINVWLSSTDGGSRLCMATAVIQGQQGYIQYFNILFSYSYTMAALGLHFILCCLFSLFQGDKNKH